MVYVYVVTLEVNMTTFSGNDAEHDLDRDDIAATATAINWRAVIQGRLPAPRTQRDLMIYASVAKMQPLNERTVRLLEAIVRSYEISDS
jgi:hypothetical protein